MNSKILIILIVLFSISSHALESCEKLSIKLEEIKFKISESRLLDHDKKTLYFAIKGQMSEDIYDRLPEDEFICDALYRGLTSTIELTFNNLRESL